MPAKCSLNSMFSFWARSVGRRIRDQGVRPSSADVVTSAIFQAQVWRSRFITCGRGEERTRLVPSASRYCIEVLMADAVAAFGRCSVRIGTPPACFSFSCVRFGFCLAPRATRPNAVFPHGWFFSFHDATTAGIEYHATLPAIAAA